jgi:RDD family
MSSAQLDLHRLDEVTDETEAKAPFGLKEQVAERLAAHRARRTQRSASQVAHIAPATPAKASSSRIAAAVAERYAHSQSYRAFLASEAEAAIRRAEAAAEVAALTAQAVTDAQYQLLAELDQWALTPPPVAAAAPVLLPASTEAKEASRPTEPSAATKAVAEATPHVSGPGLTVRLYEDVAHDRFAVAPTSNYPFAHQPFDEAEGLALDEEIAFRQSPVFDEPIGPPIDIPANLIEFPRQLVAARKARPRLAEGPLREDADHASQNPETAQLRIFEVEATQISTTPVVESVEPEWSSIMLGALPPTAPVESTEPLFDPLLPLQAATLNLRLMAGIVDACIVLASLLAFTAVFATTVDKLAGGQITGNAADPIAGSMTLQAAVISVLVVFGVLTLIYHLLFFTLAEATPGMRYARIALCTFSDQNPTRAAMRRRLFAMVLSACPLGIGFLWACLDDDRLGWHDRISRMYQRSY